MAAELSRVDADLLAAFGRTWDDPPVLHGGPDDWVTTLARSRHTRHGSSSDDALSELRRRTAARLRAAAGTHLVRRDPRAGLFLGFWDAVATIDHVALVVGPPDDAVHDLIDAEGMTVEAGARLWLRYVVAGWLGAPARRVVTVDELRSDPDAVVDELTRGTAYDPAEVRRGLHVAAGRPTGHGTSTPSRTVGEIIDGHQLELARSVHQLLVAGDDDRARPLLVALASGWRATERSDAARTRAEAGARIAAEQHARAERLAGRVESLEADLAATDRRWATTTRAAVAAEGRAQQEVAHYRREAERVHREASRELRAAQDRLDRLNRDYERLRRRRIVRLGLSAAEFAKPLFRLLRTRAGRSEAIDDGSEAAEATTARVFTVLLNYRHVDDTLGCLEALRAGDDWNLFPVVVDNGSGPSAVARLREQIGARPLLTAGDNLGYAGGNNLGIRYALDRGCEFVWILNPDARPEPVALPRLLATMRANPDAGVVGARLLNGGSDPVTIATDGGIIDWSQGGATDHVNVGERDAGSPAGPAHPVDYVPGACMLVRRAVFEDVGLLPERWFLYFEETDFNLRVRRAGWRTLVDPRARVWHYKRSSGRVPAPYYVYYYVRNRLAFSLEHLDDWDPDAVPGDLEYWITAWHDKVARAAPDWLATFTGLVDLALADARAGVVGRRDDIGEVPAADEAPPDEPELDPQGDAGQPDGATAVDEDRRSAPDSHVQVRRIEDRSA